MTDGVNACVVLDALLHFRHHHHLDLRCQEHWGERVHSSPPGVTAVSPELRPLSIHKIAQPARIIPLLRLKLSGAACLVSTMLCRKDVLIIDR